MQIDKGIAMLCVSAEMMGRTETIYPTLLWDNQDVLLIDTAYPGQFPLLSQEFARAGIGMDRITKIIVTHQDLDHIGGLQSIKENGAAEIEVLASDMEKPYIQGDRRLLKLTPDAIDQAVASMPPQVPEEWKAAFRRTLENPPRSIVQTTVAGGQYLPYCGGMTVIDTPGHTPGHISLYHHPSRTLIAADALIVADGELHGPVPHYCIDYELAMKSLAHLLPYDIRQIVCYHGGLYSGPCHQRIKELAGEGKPTD